MKAFVSAVVISAAFIAPVAIDGAAHAESWTGTFAEFGFDIPSDKMHFQISKGVAIYRNPAHLPAEFAASPLA